MDEAVRRDRLCMCATELDCLRQHRQDIHLCSGTYRPGVTEGEINYELQSFLRRVGDVECDKDRYIVASGPLGRHALWGRQ